MTRRTAELLDVAMHALMVGMTAWGVMTLIEVAMRLVP